MRRRRRDEESLGDCAKRAVVVMLALGTFFAVLPSPVGQGLLEAFVDWYMGLVVKR